MFAGVTCKDRESYVDELRAIHREMNSPVELMFDVPREKLVPLVAQAGIHLHTAQPPGTKNATAIGMPVSIAESMATGHSGPGAQHTRVRRLCRRRGRCLPRPRARRGADCLERDLARRILGASLNALVERAFGNHADLLLYRPMFEDWCALVSHADS